ncbi:MAG: hypothetical protein M3063_11700, partial [Actinomycetota bacterium]|nr:hypothetical protein [Actinomycetota bacterium]
MKARLLGLTALTGAACLVGQYLAVPMAANAVGTGPVPFSQAKFSGYASGDEAHLGAVTVGTTTLADVEQAFSGATTDTRTGLTSVLKDPDPTAATNTGTVIQPAQAASVKAYGTGSGLEVGVGTSSTAAADANQLKLSGQAESIAPPISPAVVKTTSVPTALRPVISGDSLTGIADTLFDPNVCPLGQPISYGLGAGSNVSLVNTGLIPPVVQTATASQTANTTSYTYVNANPDGTFGLATTATEIVTPLTINLSALLKLSVTLSGSQDGLAPANPVTLTTLSTGEGTSRSALTNNNFLTVTLTTAGIPAQIIPPTLLSGLTAPMQTTIPLVGTITINTLTQASAGNTASAAYTLLGLNLNLASLLPLVNLEVGHLVAGASV